MKKQALSVAYMFALTLCFTFMVSAVKYINDDRILRNQQIKLQKIILQVLNIETDKNLPDQDVAEIFEKRVRTVQARDRNVYLGYEEDEETLMGYAFPVGGPGFWGPIYGMAAVNPTATKLIGLAFYKHSETPGLGARISDASFTDQFADLPVFPIEGEDKIFYLKPAETGKKRNELDAVTGATGTSRAVELFLNREIDLFLTDLWKDITLG
jgi:Na+-transporting NADH:ubiquinone oxidoreductase subunit C